MEQLSLVDKTDQLFRYLVNNREEVLSKIKVETRIYYLLNEFLKGDPLALEYADKMKMTPYKAHFTELTKIDQQISDSNYRKALEKIYNQIMNQILQENDDDKINGKVISQMFALLTQNQTTLMQSVHAIQNKPEHKKDEPKEDPKKEQPKKEESKKEGPKKEELKKQIKAQQIQKQADSKVEQKKQFESKPSAQKSQAKVQAPKTSDSKPTFEVTATAIKAKDIYAVVRYFDLTVDLQGYNYTISEVVDRQKKLKKQRTFSLLEEIKTLIRRFLQKNTVSVKRRGKQVRILDNKSYLKSPDAGNYSFDPFHNSVQIKIYMVSKGQFVNDFKVDGVGDDMVIKVEKVSKFQQWNKALEKLTPKSSISRLMDFIGEKRQADKSDTDKIAEALKVVGGALLVEDLFYWTDNQYQKINIKATFIHEIKQMLDIVRDCSRTGTEKSYSQKKRERLRIANSHKILRYAVYSSCGMSEVNKLPWLNLDNVQAAVNLVREEIHNTELLDQLNKYFVNFGLDPMDDPIKFSRGMVLYGPPGTGKTVLTEILPDIMGFHLIEMGLSAADFSKSLVGQSSRMIRDLVNRANQSPYLLCSVGIDEVDGLVPDRKDKDEKNKGQGISMLLSVIGGNKDVPNLVYMTSTNYLKKIDEAIRRRLSGQFQVGRPNPEAREKIVLSKLSYLKDKRNLLDLLVTITTNFTGAALGGVNNALAGILRKKEKNKKPVELNEDEIIDTAIQMARQFTIKLGVYPLPEIYKSDSSKNRLTKRFLSIVGDNMVVVQCFNQGGTFGIAYPNKVSKYVGGEVVHLAEIEDQKFDIIFQKGKQIACFQNYLQQNFDKKFQSLKFQKNKEKSFEKQLDEAISKIPNNSNDPYLLLIQESEGQDKYLIEKVKKILSCKNKRNIYLVIVLSLFIDRVEFLEAIYGKVEQIQNQVKYSGRLLVELNNETRLAFELNSQEKQSKIAFKLFLKSEQNKTIQSVIPQLVNFFTKQQVSYILLLDYELLLQNDAFEEKKMLEIMEEKMSEAKNYQRVAVIINVDSLIMISENASDSNFGRSISYSVVNHNMYQILLNYMSGFAKVDQITTKWISIICKNEELVKKVKRDLDWPIYPEEQKKKDEEEELDKEKRCLRCKLRYTARKNKEDRTCMGHPGQLLNDHDVVEQTSVNELRKKIASEKKRKKNDKDNRNEEDKYTFTCCYKNLTEPGCRPFYHYCEGEKDELEEEKSAFQSNYNP